MSTPNQPHTPFAFSLRGDGEPMLMQEEHDMRDAVLLEQAFKEAFEEVYGRPPRLAAAPPVTRQAPPVMAYTEPTTQPAAPAPSTFTQPRTAQAIEAQLYSEAMAAYPTL